MNLKRFGVIGSVLLMVSVFSPVANLMDLIQITGGRIYSWPRNASYVTHSFLDTAIFLVGSSWSLILTLRCRYRDLTIVSLGLIMVFIFMVFQIHTYLFYNRTTFIDDVETLSCFQSANNPEMIMNTLADKTGYGWGLILYIVGIGLLLYTGYSGQKKQVKIS